MRWPCDPGTAGTSSVVTHPTRCCAASPAPRAASRSRSSSRHGRSTAWPGRCWGRSRVGRWPAEHQRYDGPWPELVRCSGRVLQGLTFQPTGAVVAAATTSLPEEIGGSRNWDYRYAWLRDASLTLDALWIAACPDEARAFVAWLVGAAAGDLRAGSTPQIMYGVAGEHDLAERTLDHLDGWRDSRPVRVGNGAYDQIQLDVYGEVLAAVARLRDELVPFDDTTQWFLRQLAEAAIDSWEQPDQGLWEVRSGPQHMLNSKLLCWVALDRAIDLAE